MEVSWRSLPGLIRQEQNGNVLLEYAMLHFERGLSDISEFKVRAKNYVDFLCSRRTNTAENTLDLVGRALCPALLVFRVAHNRIFQSSCMMYQVIFFVLSFEAKLLPNLTQPYY